nr:integrase, catalytic region, zinc finger, CCHC-type, peptidase aspartic, catalytic [Tanacetum cinerariifolium]
MRTRSSCNLPVESPPNPSTSNPKLRNRRRSNQPFILEESPVDTMADQRTKAELLRAPTEGYAEAIVVPPILAKQFELKHSLINMMTARCLTTDPVHSLETDLITPSYNRSSYYPWMILESVEHGPLLWPSVTEDGVTRLKKYSELSSAEATQADCDVKATNIILPAFPSEIYALVSTHKVAKDLWERIQMLMQGTSLTKQERECKLYDAFDKFAYQKGENFVIFISDFRYS